MADDNQKPWEKYKKKAAPPAADKPWLKYQSEKPPENPRFAALGLSGYEPPVPDPAPENARFPRLGRTGYDVADFLANAMPTALSVGGGVLGAPSGPVGAVAGGFLGGAAGDRLRRTINEAMYKDLEAEPMYGARSTAVQGLLGGFQESQAQAVNYFAQPLLKNLNLTRMLLEEARAGKNIRLTTGEASRWPSLKIAENVTSHWPGGAGTFQKFRTEQEADINRQMNEQLRRLSERNLSAGEAGEEVRNAVRQAKAQFDPGIEIDVARVQTAQEDRTKAVIDRQLDTLSPRQTSAEDFGRQVQSQLQGQKAQLETTAERDLQRLRETQRADLDSAFTQDLHALNPIPGTTTEQAGAAIRDHLRAQQDAANATLKTNLENVRTQQQADLTKVIDQQARAIHPTDIQTGATVRGHLGAQQDAANATLETNLTNVRTQQQADITKVLNQQSHALSPQQLTSQDTGLLVQSTLRDLEQQSTNAINAKYAQVLEKLGKKPGTFIPKAQLDELAKTVPEAKALLDEADLLFKQEQARFDVPIVKEVLRKPAEEIASIQANASLEDLKVLEDYLPPHVQQAAARDLWESMVERATKRGVTDADSLANQLKTLTPARGQRIFKQNWDTIVRSADTIDGINRTADQAAERFTTQARAPFANKLTKDVLNNPSEKLPSLMMKGSNEDLLALKAALPADIWNSAARDLWESMVERATKRGVTGADSLANQLKTLTPERGKRIFEGNWDTIVRSADTIDGINTTADEAAKQFTTQARAPFSNTLAKDILSEPPEQIASLMMNASNEDLRALKNLLPPDMYNAAAGEVLKRIISPPRGGIVSEKSLATAMADLRPDRGRLIFGDDRYDSIAASIGRFNEINKSAEASAAQVQARSSPFSQSGLYSHVVQTNKPEEIVNEVRKAGLEELRQLTSSLSPEMQQDLRRNVLEKILEQPGVRDPQTGVINEKKFAGELQKLTEPRGRIIFGDQYDGLVNSSKVLDRINEATRVQTATISGRSSRYDAGLLKQIIDTDNPLLISGYLAKAGPDELRRVMKDLPAPTREAAARNTLESFIAPARAPQHMETGELDPKQLAKSLNENLKQLGPERGRAIFGKEYDNIIDIAAMLQTIGYSESSMMGKMHMAGLITGIFGSIGAAGGAALRGAPGAAAGALLGGAGALASSVPLAKTFAWMLTSPNFSEYVVRNMRDLTAAVLRGGIPMTLNETVLRTTPAKYPQTQTDELRQYEEQGIPP